MANWWNLKLIPEWQRAYKLWSVWLQSALLSVCAIYPYVPFLQQYAPGWWVAPIAVFTIVARIIKQKRSDDVCDTPR